MSGLVVDASVVIAWLFDDEEEPRADSVYWSFSRRTERWYRTCGIWRPATPC